MRWLLVFLLSSSTIVLAQQQTRGNRIETGTTIDVRTTESIEVDRRDTQVFRGTVERDVYGEDSRQVAIPRGSPVELMVRRSGDTDMTVDLDSVTVNGERYAVRTEPNQVTAQGGLIGTIVGAIAGARGTSVKLPQGTILSFRLERALDVDVPDRGVDRDGRHWHDWDRDR
jgi:hypothetical protein